MPCLEEAEDEESEVDSFIVEVVGKLLTGRAAAVDEIHLEFKYLDVEL